MRLGLSLRSFLSFSGSHKSTPLRRSSLYLTLLGPKAVVGMYTCLPLLVVAGFAGVAVAAPIERALPAPVSVATAKTYLADLTVAVDSNSPAYARTEFKTWDISSCLAYFRRFYRKHKVVNVYSKVSGKCDTRESE